MRTASSYAMEITEEEFQGVISNGHKLVVADFFAEWCMPCLMISPVIDDLAESMKEVKFVKVNIEDNKELSKKHNVSNIPCLIIFRDGKEIGRITGNNNPEIIEKRIRGYL